MRRISLAVLVLGIVAVAAPPLVAKVQDPVIVSARQFSQQGNHDTAIAMLRSALTTRPSDAALKAELVAVLGLKEAALRRQLAELSREIAALRGPEKPSSTETLASGCGAATASTPIRVGGDIKAPQKRRDVKPVYPAEGQVNRVQGIVIVEAVIGCDGSVTEVRVLRGHPLLNDAALDAVRQWQYTPTLLNGVPVPVIMTMTVTFTLG